MTFATARCDTASTAEPVSFGSTEAARRFEQRAVTAIQHATQHGLFTTLEGARMLERVYALTAKATALLAAGAQNTGADVE